MELIKIWNKNNRYNIKAIIANRVKYFREDYDNNDNLKFIEFEFLEYKNFTTKDICEVFDCKIFNFLKNEMEREMEYRSDIVGDAYSIY